MISLSDFFNIKNLSFLKTPRTFASRSENISDNLESAVLTMGHFSSIWISNNLTRSSAKGILSIAPGASSFLYNDFATSNSGEIIISIGKFSLVKRPFQIGFKNSFDLIRAIFLGILKRECAIWQTIMFVSSFLVTAMIISAFFASAFSKTEGYVAIPTIPLASWVSLIFWISEPFLSITVTECPCLDSWLQIEKPTLPAPHIIIFIYS